MDQNIFQQLRFIAQKNQPIRLLNVYQGVPISYDATIVSVINNAVKMSVNKYQSVCLRLQKTTYFESPLLSGVIKANVLTVDLVSNTCVVGDFQYSNDAIGKRKLVRAQPAEVVDVLLMNDMKTQRTKVQLIDVSLIGMGLSAAQLFFIANIFKMGTTVSTTFNLPGGPQGQLIQIKVSGLIQNIFLDERKQLYRIGLRIQPDDVAKPILMQYIARRQSEIMRDLKLLYDKMLAAEPNKTSVP